MISESKELLSAISLDHITCSLDIWTDNSLMNSYIDFSFVFIDPSNLKMKYYQYKMDHFPYSHTAANINEHVWAVCTEIFESVSNLRVISDSASYMVVGLKGFKHFRCAAHRLNTIVSEGIFISHIFLKKIAFKMIKNFIKILSLSCGLSCQPGQIPKDMKMSYKINFI